MQADCAHPWWVALPKRVFRCNDCGVEYSPLRKRLSNNPVRLQT